MRLLAMLLSVALWVGPAHAQTVILYARADRQVAEQMRSVARIYGSVWMDSDIPPGMPWRAEVARRIRGARVVMLLWSASAARSPEVGAEWRQALASGRRVVPVLLDGEPMPAELGQRQWVILAR